MEDLEQRKLYNKCGIDESIDLSDIIDGEIRPIDISELKRKKHTKLKHNKKIQLNLFRRILLVLSYIPKKVFEIILKIQNSKNPEMLIIIYIIFGIFFHLLSDPPILLNQTNFYFIENIISYLRFSIIMVFFTSLFFSFAYMHIFFIRKEVNKSLIILPLIIQFFLFVFSDNQLNQKINFGSYRKFVLLCSTFILFCIGLCLKNLIDFLQRKSRKIKITVLVFFFTLVIYMNILIKGTCEKDMFSLDENLINNSIGCDLDEKENNSCFSRIMDDLFDLSSFSSEKNIFKNNLFLEQIYKNKINDLFLINEQKNINDTLKKEKNNNIIENVNKINIDIENSDNKYSQNDLDRKKIYVFPDIKNIFFENFINIKFGDFKKNIQMEKNLNFSKGIFEFNESDFIKRLNPYEFVDNFLDNIIKIDTGIHIEININNNSSSDNKTLHNKNIKVKDPINYKNKDKNDNDIFIRNKEVNLNTSNHNLKTFETLKNEESYFDKNINKSLSYFELEKIYSNSDIFYRDINFLNNSDTKIEKEIIANGNSKIDILNKYEIFYDNRDPKKPFININPLTNNIMENKIKKFESLKEESNTIILLNFENMDRKKFKNKFPNVYNFLRKFYKKSINNHNYLNEFGYNNLDEKEKNMLENMYSKSFQGFQFMKFFPNFLFEKNLTNYKKLIDNLNNQNYLTLYAMTDINMHNFFFNKTKMSFQENKKQISNNFYDILKIHDKIILPKFYTNFENLIINRFKNENKILNNEKLILEYSTKFISNFSNSNKFIHLKFDQNSFSKSLDSEIFVWLKNLKNKFENKKIIFILYSNISEEKPFYINYFSDIYKEEIEWRSMMLFYIFPTNKFDTKFIELVNLNENYPICNCDFYEMINYIISGKESILDEKKITLKDKFICKYLPLIYHI